MQVMVIRLDFNNVWSNWYSELIFQLKKLKGDLLTILYLPEKWKKEKNERKKITDKIN